MKLENKKDLAKLDKNKLNLTLDQEIVITDSSGQYPLTLSGHLSVPENAIGLVIFAHGSSSSRYSPRNQYVAKILQNASIATLLFDLLTEKEAQNRQNIFNIPLLASRLVMATKWIIKEGLTGNLALGFFGASTGGAAALWAAAELGPTIKVIVSRGGRPDLAMARLSDVEAQTLLIVGGKDFPVISLNQNALPYLANAELITINKATHLFEEPGALKAVAKHTTHWFKKFFAEETQAKEADENIFIQEVIQRSKVLTDKDSLQPLLEQIGKSKIVMLGESTHGTKEFYQWRRLISERLIEDYGFNFMAIEGDWPACFEVNKYIQGEKFENIEKVLGQFHRWPSWMWANEEFLELIQWLQKYNLGQGPKHYKKGIGLYGLDIYSMYESMAKVIIILQKYSLTMAQQVRERYSCFEAYNFNEKAYARSLIKYPKGCQEESLKTLHDLLKLRTKKISREEIFDLQQNARIVANAEDYYRTMIHGDQNSWNVRERHMAETLGHLLDKEGRNSKAIVWAHNSHIGDYRGTDMSNHGLVNLGGLARQIWGAESISLVGFSTYQGNVLAANAWDGPSMIMKLPSAKNTSHEHALYQVTKKTSHNAYFFSLLDSKAQRGLLAKIRGQRSVGVVYNSGNEGTGPYVPTSLSNCYDAFVFMAHTTAITPFDKFKDHFDSKEIPVTWPQGL